MPKERRHAAIMFTDIVGYTALMGSDEDKAFDILSKNRDIHKQAVDKFHGTLIKEMGDGMLISFSLASDAVYCAIEIQKNCKEQSIPLKIGIHEGEMIFEGADVLGDAVNVASRIESDAHEGCIYISGSVYRDIKNKADIEARYIKTKRFKNVDEPIKVYQIEIDHETSEESKPDRFPPRLKKITYGILTFLILLLIISFVYNSFRENDPSTSEKENIGNSIAVLPFDDLSPEQDQEYLGDGLAEEIINRLTKINGLNVIGRTSSFQFKGKDTDLKTIGEMLGVNAVLEGSIQKSGDQLRITAQLIDADNGFHFWSERFDRPMKDIFQLQDEIALIVATKINSNLNDNEPEIVANNDQVNSEAYENFLMGRNIINENKSFVAEIENLFPIVENFFLESLKIEPNYALAHAGLAQLYGFKIRYGNNTDSVKLLNYTKSRKIHIRKAYQLNPKSDYVNRIKGHIHLWVDEIDSAYLSYVNAIKFNPENKYNYIGLAYFLRRVGLLHEAALLIEAAKKSNPLDIDLLYASVDFNFLMVNYEKGLKELEIINYLSPDDFRAYSLIFRFYILIDEIDKAEEQFTILKKRFPERNIRYWEGLLYASKGDTTKALAINESISWYYSKLGMKEEYIPAFIAERERAKVSSIGSSYIWLINRTTYDWLKEDPRTRKIIQEEKEKYEIMKTKYGNLKFLNL